ncbi:MAG TPA: hypothetical protein VND24_06930 [Steroidobacteraceae bacterium]|nr:hypothetical protein [Steroidobacteraceae bacterium]
MFLTCGRARAAAACGRAVAVRRTAAAALIALLTALSGCVRGPHHPGWVIHSALEIVGPPPAGGYRLVFPYIVGDFYGSPDTGDFVVPVSLTPRGFTLDLNRTQRALESELAPTEFSLRFLKIAPASARIARLAPQALQRKGIEPVGTVEWRDAQSRQPLMLVYIDRAARIAGSLTRGGETIRYDIRVATPGYVWIGGIRSGEHETRYTVVPRPQHLMLTITTGSARSGV